MRWGTTVKTLEKGVSQLALGWTERTLAAAKIIALKRSVTIDCTRLTATITASFTTGVA